METKSRPTFLLRGVTICELAWRQVHGIKIRRFVVFLFFSCLALPNIIDLKNAEALMADKMAYMDAFQFRLHSFSI